MCCLKFENDVYAELRKDMPDVGEKVDDRRRSRCGRGEQYLESRIKARLVIEEGTADRQEKLSSDYTVYTKQQIKRLGGEKRDDILLEDIDPQLIADLKELMKE